jgi:Na+/melibiose symporter-like transporter
MVGPFPAVLLLLSFVAVWFYPITRERHEEIRQEIAARSRPAEGGRHLAQE